MGNFETCEKCADSSLSVRVFLFWWGPRRERQFMMENAWKLYRFSHKTRAIVAIKCRLNEIKFYGPQKFWRLFTKSFPEKWKLFLSIFSTYRSERTEEKTFPFVAFCHFSHNPLRNSEARREFFSLCVSSSSWRSLRPKKGKKIRQYRIKVLSTPSRSSLYS